jgi:hypothetical protein
MSMSMRRYSAKPAQRLHTLLEKMEAARASGKAWEAYQLAEKFEAEVEEYITGFSASVMTRQTEAQRMRRDVRRGHFPLPMFEDDRLEVIRPEDFRVDGKQLPRVAAERILDAWKRGGGEDVRFYLPMVKRMRV